MNASRLLVFGLCLIPVVLTAQTKEQLQSIQRDVAQVQEQVKELQTSQDAKMAALQTSLQQTADASSKVAAGLTALQHSVDMKLTEQQNKLEEPVATMGTKVDAMSDTFQ